MSKWPLSSFISSLWLVFGLNFFFAWTLDSMSGVGIACMFDSQLTSISGFYMAMFLPATDELILEP